MKDFKECIVYQIWPRSFCDSNGDGIGDLPGITSKLDYLEALGIDYLWLSPIYSTQNADYGYDIDDYRHINPEYGTMEDFDILLEETKKRGMNLILDLVLNHTSDHHMWFQEALKGKDSPYRDYYFFRDGRMHDIVGNPVEKQLPSNNWLSAFGQSAWTYDEASNQYYLTMFTNKQCDLNWENPSVREGFYDIMRFWLDKGIAGFRMDVVNTIAKDTTFPHLSTTEAPDFPFQYITSLPKSHIYLHEMYEKVLKYYDCITIGEGMTVGLKDLNLYTIPERHELNLMFQFDLSLLGCGRLGKYDFRKFYHFTVRDMKKVIDHWQEGTQEAGGFLGNYLSNHDQPRQVSHYGDPGRYRIESAKALAVLNCTLRGTPFLYQGEEIGMTDCKLTKSEWRDYEALNAYQVLQSMMHLPSFLAYRLVQLVSRDNARTPMQWNSLAYAGFSTVEPWIKLNPNYKEINVAHDLRQKNSLFRFYQSLIAVRRKYPALSYGSYKALFKEHRQIICYEREYEGTLLLIVINLSKRNASLNLKSTGYTHGVLILGTHLIDTFTPQMKLSPYESRIYVIKNNHNSLSV